MKTLSIYSIFSGLSVCKGDCAVFIPDYGKPSPNIIVKMYLIWEQNHKEQ